MAILSNMDGYMVLGSTVNSDSIFIGAFNKLGVQTIVTNTDADGTLKLQVSNDESNWVDGYFSLASNSSLMDSYDVLAGQPFNLMISHEAYTSFARLRWESTSGSGGLTFYVKVKK